MNTHNIAHLDVEVTIPEGSFTALKSMAFLRTPKATAEYKPQMDHIVQHQNKVGAVIATEGSFSLIGYLSCSSGNWSSTGEVNVVNASELTRVEESDIKDTKSLGASVLYKGTGAQTIDYPQYVNEETAEQKRWW